LPVYGNVAKRSGLISNVPYLPNMHRIFHKTNILFLVNTPRFLTETIIIIFPLYLWRYIPGKIEYGINIASNTIQLREK